MNFDTLCDSLVIFINEINEINEISENKITRNTALLDEGVVDSFNILEIILHIEHGLSIRLDPSEIPMESFFSINSLVSWLSDNNKLTATP